MENFKPKYDFKEVEDKRYDKWVESGYFQAGKDQTKNHLPSLSRHQM